MPMKEEEIGFTEELVEIPIEDEVITLVRHDERYVWHEILLIYRFNHDISVSISAVKSGAEGFSQSAVTAGVTGRAPVGAGEGRGIPRPPVTYVCSRCSKPGHYVKFCPTNGDPAFDPEMKLMNIPKNSRRKVTNLDGVDVTNKTVCP